MKPECFGMMGLETSGKGPKAHHIMFKHGGRCVMVWACLAAAGTVSLGFIDDVTALPSDHIQTSAANLIDGTSEQR